MSKTSLEKAKKIAEVIDTLDRLRVECPWDRKQTNESLRPNTVEEVYELCDALMRDEPQDIKKELGDVLLHVLFYSKIGEEQRRFDIGDVADALNKKLIFRHPHVFGDTSVDGSAQKVAENWEQIKLKEKGGNKTVLAGVPAALPAMIKAFRIQEKAANVGFDWDKADDAMTKMKEELGEFETEIKHGDDKNMESELGDLLFSVINVARLLGINPENALEKTNLKFIRRFNHIEQSARNEGRALKDMTLEEMDKYWIEAKISEK